MKKIALILCIGFLSGCATPTPIPQDIKDKVAQLPTDDLPRNSSLEQTRCPKSRYHSFDKRMACKNEVRRELAARKIMREQKDTLEQNNTKEQSNEAIKN
ncbi:MAG: hypothetical protein HYS17_03240 [Micavibrio aeruginosavorus]|uniref:Lipoprotein n=1 Tax=Micavibrio aeruginosavorus TaxID=349221 RepID=A0A7T5UIK9_9BACT|nr:MAG: hypothetical protein HYS17_03240 [Micavibrio aeruginosavorus]